ncbi:unnamed protein product [Miscanthus lutarioriparius]|uniref:Uncharacterized protein n=1 Tax=Miscanthus lutarioriparius TaxID=422564 RepID=A0A811P6K3_9POAL|nr:unnamed protein product [Miscanthus lutarioriparius]
MAPPPGAGEEPPPPLGGKPPSGGGRAAVATFRTGKGRRDRCWGGAVGKGRRRGGAACRHHSLCVIQMGMRREIRAIGGHWTSPPPWEAGSASQ